MSEEKARNIVVYTVVILASILITMIMVAFMTSFIRKSEDTTQITFEKCGDYENLYYNPQDNKVYTRIYAYSTYYAPNGKPYFWDGCNLVQMPEE